MAGGSRTGTQVATRCARAGLAAAALAAALVLALAGGVAAGPERKVLRGEPYYLSLHRPGDGPARGTVLLLHGGGWRGDLGPAADERMGAAIERHTALGFNVANLAYRSGARSLADALDAFDHLRSRWPGQPICLAGQSAGAHLALLVAARRGADVACVLDLAGPPSLVRWGGASANAHGRRLAAAAFGTDREQLRRLSPARYAERIEAPVLVAAARCDRIISFRVQRAFARRLARAGATVARHALAPGADAHVPHCEVEARSLARLHAKEAAFLARYGSR